MSERRCANDADTQHAGEQFARVLRPGDIVLLSGHLGAGKTTFTKGVAKGLGVSERVTSPTFTMVREHACHNDQGITTLQHCDVYRVESLAEVLDLDLGELAEESAVVVIEWGELAESLFGRAVLRVDIEIGDDDARTLRVGGSLDDERSRALEQWSRQ
ncbi:MAG: tRNA (adenosine(37)-N6)-threonylcarbamoyltransferase complex ATPase subunit type 1 TsaE [Acidimicrobiales bacterium]